MSNTYLSNLGFVPETFKDYVDGQILKQSNFLNSEAVVDAQVDLAPIYGSTVTLPSYDPLSGADEVHGATAPTAANLTTSADVAAILNRRKVYGSNDLVSYFTGVDPFRNAGNKFAEYWAQRMDETLVATAIGSAIGIDAISAGTVINDISSVATTGAIISAESIIDTQALMGEFMNDLECMVVHPKVLAVLRKQNLVNMIPNSDGTKVFPYYGDLRIVVSSTAGLNVTTNYYTLLVGKGAFGFADGTKPEHVLEYSREISHADVYGSMRRYVLHPYGAKWLGASVAGATPTNAELGTLANWSLGASNVNGYKVRVLKHRIIANS